MNLSITPQFTQSKNIQNNKNQGLNIFAFPALRPNLRANSNLAPLARDTVSFSGKRKVVEVAAETVQKLGNQLRADKIADGRIDDFRYEMALLLEKEAEVPMGYFQNVMKTYFKKFVSIENNDDRIIQSLGFRIKSSDSIYEKLNAAGYKAKKKAADKGEILFYTGKNDAQQLIGDIIGGRIILRDSSKAAVKKVLQTLGKMVKDGKFKITEIECYRPVITSVPENFIKGFQKDFGIKLDDKKVKAMKKSNFFDYADSRDLAEFSEICRSTYPGLTVKGGQDLPNGYQAIHVSFILPEGSKGEIQIMGRDIEKFKDLLEDYVYKTKCHKEVKYQPLAERLAPLGDAKEDVLQTMHVDYTRWAYIAERLKAPESFSHKPREKFLTAPKEILARGLGYNQLLPLARRAKSFEKAEREAAKAKLSSK